MGKVIQIRNVGADLDYHLECPECGSEYWHIKVDKDIENVLSFVCAEFDCAAEIDLGDWDEAEVLT